MPMEVNILCGFLPIFTTNEPSYICNIEVDLVPRIHRLLAGDYLTFSHNNVNFRIWRRAFSTDVYSNHLFMASYLHDGPNYHRKCFDITYFDITYPVFNEHSTLEDVLELADLLQIAEVYEK
jgi:hypothetical protein